MVLNTEWKVNSILEQNIVWVSESLSLSWQYVWKWNELLSLQLCLQLWVVLSIGAGFCDFWQSVPAASLLCCCLLKLNKQAIVNLDVAEAVFVTSEVLAVET